MQKILRKQKRCFKKALAFAREQKERRSEALVLKLLGSIYRSTGEYEEAEAYCLESMSIYRELNDHDSEILMLQRLIDVYQRWGKHDKVKEYKEKMSSKMREQLYKVTGNPEHLRDLAQRHELWGQYETAIDYYERTVARIRDMDNRRGEARTLRVWAGCIAELGTT